LTSSIYHIDSLLQLSEIFKQMSEFEKVAEMIERCLYAYESAFHPFFNPALGNCRLSYVCEENRYLLASSNFSCMYFFFLININARRGFFLALFRQAQIMGRQSCNITALEVFFSLYLCVCV
jgi:hypothetical protein